MKWIERLVLVLVIAVIAVACDPLATNNKLPDVASLSDLMLPAPSVVQGEVMKDSTGVETPLKLYAFDSEGRVLTNQAIQITVVDPSIHVDQFGYVHGLSLDSAGARVIAGVGALQTPQVRIPVTVHPDIASAPSGQTFALNFPVPVVDSSNQGNWSPSLDVTITGPGPGNVQQGAQGFIVKYTITRQPAGAGGAATAYLIDSDPAKKTSRDTTNSSGKASRRVVLRSGLLVDNTKTDTIVVRATASYSGLVISGFPIDFTIQTKKTP